MKPGPPRICECGDCCRCNKRRSHMAYYHRNAAAISEKNTERKRQRKAGVARSTKITSDEELDRQAAEWLERETP